VVTQKKEVTEVNRDNILKFTKKEIQTIKNTVAKKANDDEFRMFMALAKRYGLDPFNKEIFFWKIDGNPTIMTSRDGYLKIADRYEEYDGLVSDVVRKNDKFRRKKDDIDHEYGTDRGKIIGAYALVYRSDRSYPVYVFAPYEEYRATTKAWRQYPSAMVLKVAESMSLKRAFTVSGLVSKEEMQVRRMNNNKADKSKTQIEDVTKTGKNKSVNVSEEDTTPDALSDREQILKEIIDENEKLKNELFDYLRYIKDTKKLKKVSINKLKKKEFQKLKTHLIELKRKAC